MQAVLLFPSAQELIPEGRNGLGRPRAGLSFTGGGARPASSLTQPGGSPRVDQGGGGAAAPPRDSLASRPPNDIAGAESRPVVMATASGLRVRLHCAPVLRADVMGRGSSGAPSRRRGGGEGGARTEAAAGWSRARKEAEAEGERPCEGGGRVAAAQGSPLPFPAGEPPPARPPAEEESAAAARRSVRPRPPTPAMRGAAPERGQERLPPKKRELPAAASEERVPADEAVSGPGGRLSQAVPCCSEAGGLGLGLGLDQYGLLYKVAVPPASFSPVVNVGPLPPAFGMSASQLLPPQPAALPYSPLHYAQLPPALLQFVGSHYSVPYTVPPGFLPVPLPASASLAASHIPHLVPYAPLLTEDAAPPPALPSHGLGKSPAAGSQPLDATQSRIPVYYHMSHLPASYHPFEGPVAGRSPEQPLRDSQLDPKIVPANGVQRPGEGTRETEVLDVGSTKAEGPWPRTTLADSTDTPFIASTQPASAETPVPSRRSTPDMDLEVQRVVGVLASPDYSVGAPLQKDALSPLNLSHREPAGQKVDLVRNPVDPAEKNHSQPAKSPQEQLCHRQVLHGLRMANGEQASGSLQHAALDGPGKTSPGRLLDAECGPAQGHLPSHFMKGAIIQLATGELKRVEDLQTQDFVRSAEVSGGLKIDSSTVVDVQESPWQGFVTLHFVVGEQQSKVSIDVPPEHPFFVYGQGWSSCSPERTARLFSLSCHRLQVGDVCISISLQSLNGRLAPQTSPQGAARVGRGQGLREPQVRAREKSLPEKGGAGLDSPQEPLALHGWAGPSFQRFGEESWPPLLRPSFIPQEVKLSIEGRSNAGK